MPPRSRKPAGPTPVEAIKHDDKRVNLPTADAAEAYDYQPEIKQVIYERNPALDPQLVWRGKDVQNATDLVADAPPIYIQEKIDPRVLVENLRRTAPAGEPEPEVLMFEGFDGLDEYQSLEFYEHDADWSNRMILGDSLQVMASLVEQENLRGQIQMIYIDPPYGIKFNSNWQPSVRRRDVKDGNLADAAREGEQIKAYRDTWGDGVHSYLSYLRDRLMAARELVSASGSVFLQIGDENVHLVRCLMDEVFGSENFVSVISFATTSGFTQARGLGRAGDYVLWYAVNRESMKVKPLWRESVDRQGYNWVRLPDGTSRGLTAVERAEGRLPPGARLYQPDNLISQGAASGSQRFAYAGRVFDPGNNGHWKASFPEGMRRLAIAGRIHLARNSIRYVRYPDDFGFQARNNHWSDTATGNFTDEKMYVVQTSTKVIERCMLLCTDPGDLVLDPTCGSGTTAFVAEQWGRRWVTIDTSRVALALARQRLMGARFPYYYMADTPEGRAKQQEITGKPLPPSQTRGDIKQGFVYERVQHITLKSIANNPDIKEGMTTEQIDAAIKRHAEYEVLYDRPLEDKSKVRVSGRFTVESLSPHRSLSFDQREDPAHRESISEQVAADDAAGPNFEQSILDNLRKAGIQNGRRNERVVFATLDAFPGQYLQAIGERMADDNSASVRVAISIGPQYGTVSPAYVKAAAREAVKIGDIDLVAVLGFAFDAQATEVTEADGVTVSASAEGFATVDERRLGRIPVLLVRMNVDLLMGEDLQKSDRGNLFTVFGEPDIDLRTVDGQLVVDIKGVDVFDPTTGEVRSDDTSKIALWMIDTNYNEESFFVRHCYFTGGNDPFKRLKAALKADVDVEAWESLYRTESRPFERPETGKIAVKVINDYGDEVMKVFEV